MRKRILFACAFIPLRLNAFELRFAPEWSAMQVNRLTQVAESFQSRLDHQFAWQSAAPPIAVRELVRGEHSSWVGETSGSSIALRLPPGPQGDSVFRHELAHAWLLQMCGPRLKRAPIASEVVAQTLSEDYVRLAAKPGFSYYQAARRQLRNTNFALNPRPAFEAAVGRALLQNAGAVTQVTALVQALQANHCQDLENAENEIKKILLGQARTLLRKEYDILWIDLQSKEVLVQAGAVERAEPVGSVLKPYLLDTTPQLRAPKVSTPEPSWRCGLHLAPGTAWSWQDALTYSCNGFFLNGATDLSMFAHKVSQLAHAIPSTISPAEAIGLVPSLKFTLPEVATLYADLFARNSDVLQALRATPVHGTLENVPQARAFRDWNSAIKTGTVVSMEGARQIAYLAIVTPAGPAWPAAHLLLVRAEGKSRHQLVAKALEVLRARPTPVGPRVQVSVLSLLRSPIRPPSCRDGPEVLQQSASTWRCLRGPLVVELQTRQGKPLRKEYYGTLEKVEPRAVIKQTNSVELRERQARARAGSGWRLTTSLRQYVARALVSEGSHLQLEARKALATVLASNALNASTPICDTTLCQVFNAVSVTDRQLQPFLRLADGVPVLSSPQLIQFYLGGQTSWHKQIAQATVERALHLPRLYQFRFTDGGFRVNGENQSCERVRAALHFLSCPARVAFRASALVFTGRGEGHGQGMNLTAANQLAIEGMRAPQILERWYPFLKIHAPPPKWEAGT